MPAPNEPPVVATSAPAVGIVLDDRDSRAPWQVRVDFLIELARRLHMYGTSAQRLEGAVTQVARRLKVEAEVWSNPTGMILSFPDPERPGHASTRVIRLEPGEENLSQLAAADAIAEGVLSGAMPGRDGLAALRALDRPRHPGAAFWTSLAFGLASASVTGLLPHTGWADLVTAALLGCGIGALAEASHGRPRLDHAHEAVAAFLVTLIATGVASYIAPLSLQSVIIAGLIVLMPGLTLTTAVSELAAKQLVSGTARFAGALTTLLKLAFGAVAAAQVVNLLGWQPTPNAGEALPAWMPWLTLLAGSFAFAVLFKAARRDFPLVMASVWLGYGITRAAQLVPGVSDNAVPGGVFIAGMIMTAAGNLYGRIANRPSALIRVPGIILLVPGSLGFRSFNFVFEKNVLLGLDTAFAVVAALIALVAGILFGNLLMPTRRNL
jgi:uncharacterized membrane protein YjjP (DUF1212 family)